MTTVAEVSQRYVEEHARLHPIWAVMVGIEGPRGLTDFSPEGEQARVELAKRTVAELAGADEVDDVGRLGRIFLSEVLNGELALHEAGESERLISAIAGAQSMVRQVFDLVPHSDEEDWEVVADLLAGVPAAIGGYRETLRSGLSNGRVSSVRLAATVADQCGTWSGGGAGGDGSGGGGGWFSKFVSGYGNGPLAARLFELAGAADRTYGELGSWLRDVYAPRASERDGVGDERYRLWARQLLGTVLDTDDAYEWGWQELGRLEDEKAREADKILPGAGYDEVLELLGTDHSRGIDGVEAWKAWLQDLTDRTIAQLDGRHFDIPEPLRRCEVSIPPAGSAAAPYYTPPGDAFARPGRIWFPTIGRSWFPTWDLPAIVFHEAVPGHHLQVGAVRFFHLTAAHQIGFNSAHGEGWALYAERLMDEIGGFERPEYRLGFLSMQAFRAARVVVDIGLHTGRKIPDCSPGAGEPWTYERAFEYIGHASGQSRAMCESEIDRYLSLPAQATCYKLGERSWLAGRQLARNRAGASFDLKRWHSEALALGPLGLDDLERELAKLAGGA